LVTRRTQLAIQATSVSLAALVLTALLYSDWFKACCSNDTFSSTLGIATLPAILVAMVIADGVHSATVVHFSVGMVAEGLVLLGLYHAFRLARKRMAKLTDDVADSTE
jgi:hypothetical protein